MAYYNFGAWNPDLNNFEENNMDNDLLRAAGHFRALTDQTWSIEDNGMDILPTFIFNDLPFTIEMLRVYIQQYLIEKNIILNNFTIDFSGADKQAGIVKIIFEKSNNFISLGV
jgi:hypothetical protein